MKLSDDQEKVIELLEDENPKSKVIGSAGTGKTLVMKQFMADNPDIIFRVLTPTHKASMVSKNTYRNNKNCQVMTYHKCLSYVKVYDKFGKCSFEPDKSKWESDPTIDEVVYIIDEVSMITQECLDVINEYVEHITIITPPRVIFIGDDYQLPPVKTEGKVILSPIFDLEIPGVKLTQVMRSNSNIIKDVFSKFREFVDKNKFDHQYLYSLESKEVKSYGDKNKFLKTMVEYNKTKDDVITVTYSNNSCYSYTSAVKESMGVDIDSFYQGQNVIVSSYVSSIRLASSVTLEIIKSYGKSNLVVDGKEFSFNFYDISWGGKIHNIKKICVKDRDRWNAFVAKERQKVKDKSLVETNKSEIQKLWTNFDNFKINHDFPITDNIACTAYKSQGSTYKHVFVDLKNITNCGRNKEELLFRAAYTAVSRASQSLHILL
jgi:hypothetical protein